MKIVLLGPPGSGKGTMSKLLKERLGLKPFSVGEELRKEIERGTELGKEISSYIDFGNLVPDHMSSQIAVNYVKEVEDGFILDGFPRSIPQAEALETVISNLDRSFIVLYFVIGIDALKIRLSGRIYCPKCGETYHLENLKPKKEGICDFCGTGLAVRKDDAPEHLEQRIKVFKDTTTPVICFYEKRHRLVGVDSDCSIEEQYENVLRTLKQAGMI